MNKNFKYYLLIFTLILCMTGYSTPSEEDDINDRYGGGIYLENLDL